MTGYLSVQELRTHLHVFLPHKGDLLEIYCKITNTQISLNLSLESYLLCVNMCVWDVCNLFLPLMATLEVSW